MARRRSKPRKSQPRAQRETSAGGVVFRRSPPPDGQVRFLLIRDSYKNWGFPKGHLEPGEPPAEAARREVTEETGLQDLVLHGPIKVIDWYFRSRRGDPVPEEGEGITACVWHPFDDARQTVSYDNARDVLHQAAEMQQALVQT